MKKEISIGMLSLSLFTAALLLGCGGSSTDTKSTNNTGAQTGNNSGTEMNNDGSESEGKGSNIPYLKANHANYKEHGSNITPAPVKDANAKSINWTITATTQEGAIKLQEHLAFMEAKLLADKNPRGWDKLFLMETYMKFNGYYTTSVERSGTNVVVSKNANTACAYKVISAHSDAVSGDFFASGNVMRDYSAIAENILASSECDDIRTSAEAYITQRQKRRGH